MLKIHVVRVGRHRYYVDDLIPGRAEATTVVGERPGAWTGAGSPALGLHGRVDVETFTSVMTGSDPVTGRMLRGQHGRASVAAYDLTFCAPKSVSLLHALAPREIAGQVGAGHDAAVDEAAAYLSRRAIGVRRQAGGLETRVWLPSTGMVAAEFLHRTSRAWDPHLHTHVVAANMAQGVDGMWSAVDGRLVFAHMKAAGAVYQARLRLELSDRLGVGWEVQPSGLGDVVGVDPGLRRLFSQRSVAIQEHLALHGGDRGASPRRRWKASTITRPPKDGARTVESLVPEWRSRAADFGHDLGDLVRVVGRARAFGGVPGPGFDAERLADRLVDVARGGSSLARRDVVALVAASSIAGASAPLVEAVADRMVASTRPRSPDRDAGPTERSREPRWGAEDLVRTVRAHGRQLTAAADGRSPSGSGLGGGSGGERCVATDRDRRRSQAERAHDARAHDAGARHDRGLGR